MVACGRGPAGRKRRRAKEGMAREVGGMPLRIGAADGPDDAIGTSVGQCRELRA